MMPMVRGGPIDRLANEPLLVPDCPRRPAATAALLRSALGIANAPIATAKAKHL